MDALTAHMVEKATELFIADFEQIEKRIPDCFRSNPGGRMTSARKKVLMGIIGRVERYNAISG